MHESTSIRKSKRKARQARRRTLKNGATSAVAIAGILATLRATVGLPWLIPLDAAIASAASVAATAVLNWFSTFKHDQKKHNSS